MRVRIALLLASFLLLGACADHSVKPKMETQAQVLKPINTTALQNFERVHPKAWGFLQLGEAQFKAGKSKQAAASWAKAHNFYRHIYGRYSMRLAEFDSAVGDFAYRAKAWNLARYYYSQALEIHRVMAVALPKIVQSDRHKLSMLPKVGNSVEKPVL